MCLTRQYVSRAAIRAAAQPGRSDGAALSAGSRLLPDGCAVEGGDARVEDERRVALLPDGCAVEGGDARVEDGRRVALLPDGCAVEGGAARVEDERRVAGDVEGALRAWPLRR